MQGRARRVKGGVGVGGWGVELETNSKPGAASALGEITHRGQSQNQASVPLGSPEGFKGSLHPPGGNEWEWLGFLLWMDGPMDRQMIERT